MSIYTTEVVCPSCGTVSHFTELGRDGGAFCRTCDFPLFWARAPRQDGQFSDPSDPGLRRLPGTAGRVALATLECPVCTEPNTASATVCIRCGANLHQPPEPTVVVEPVVVPVPEPAEPPRQRVLWPLILLLLLLVAGGAALALVLL